MLSGKSIRQKLGEVIGIDRKGKDLHVEPSSIDLHLGHKYGKYEQQPHPVKVWDESTFPDYWVRDCRECINRNGAIPIEPGEFILAHTQEVVDLPANYVGILQGRSSVGRLSLFVENAGLVDAGFTGDLTLELFNAGKNEIWLKPDMRIVQMNIYEHDVAPDVEYSEGNGNKYQNQRGPTPTRIYEDFREERELEYQEGVQENSEGVMLKNKE